GPVTLAGVSERQKISLSYLEQLFGKLRRHGLVESVRGPGGGYHLARPANSVSVADVIVAVDEPIDATKCGGKENCHDDKRCMTHELWANLNVHIFAHTPSEGKPKRRSRKREPRMQRSSTAIRRKSSGLPVPPSRSIWH